MRRVLDTARAFLYATVFVALWTWLAIEARALDAAYGLGLPNGLRPLGRLLAATSAPVVLWCILEFALRGRGTPAPFDAPRRFVATGPYRWVRNPMYLGAGVAMAGFGLLFGSGAILGLAAVFLGLAHVFVVLYEEPTLRDRFGDDYPRYLGAVHRWMPRRPRGTLV